MTGAAVHKIADISFAFGWAECTCLVVVRCAADDMAALPAVYRRRAWRPGSPEALRTAFMAHRSAHGLRSSDGLEDIGEPVEYVTALGTSKLSASERGRMGAAAKQAKKHRGADITIRAKHQRAVAP